MNDIIQDIRKQCRMAMNGIASTSMRKQGLVYKLNFGVPILEIKTIAQRYQPSKELAELLWKEDTRELKILATLIYPVDLFTEADAQRWVKQIPNQEIREQITLNLFQKLTFAESVAKGWSNSIDQELRTSGYWLLARLLIVNNSVIEINLDQMHYIWTDLDSENLSLRNAAILFLKNAGKKSENISIYILNEITSFKTSESSLQQEIYDSLFFEFDFLYNK